MSENLQDPYFETEPAFEAGPVYEADANIVEGLHETDTLALLFSEMRKTPLLTAAEEVALAKRIETGDMEAKDHMVRANLGLVVSIAKEYNGQGLPFTDLVQEGMPGLIRATEKYDWRKGYKFSTYSTNWIRQSIGRGLANTGRAIRLPVSAHAKHRKVDATRYKLATALEREPTDEEIASVLSMSAEKVAKIKTYEKKPISLNKPVTDDSDLELGDIIAQEEDASSEVMKKATDDILREALAANLHDEEIEVVTRHFGIGQNEPETVWQIARSLRIPKQRVADIRDQALAKLEDDENIRLLAA